MQLEKHGLSWRPKYLTKNRAINHYRLYPTRDERLAMVRLPATQKNTPDWHVSGSQLVLSILNLIKKKRFAERR